MPEAALVNFAAGETSPRSRGRADLPWYAASCRKMLNFIPEVQGPARYRPGFKFVAQTRGGAVARLIPFQVNNSLSYMLEFTSGFMRVYRNGAPVTVSRTTLTAVTQAATAVATFTATTNLAAGDDIIITDVVGMIELNGRTVRLGVRSGNDFPLLDPVTGLGVDSTGFGAYTSGGTVVEVYEIASPYLAADLDGIQFAQSLDTMYLVHPAYAPRKLTLTGIDAFSLGTYVRTADPFAAVAATLTSTTVAVGSVATRLAVQFSTSFVLDESVNYTITAFTGATAVLNGRVVQLRLDQIVHGASHYYMVDAATGVEVDFITPQSDDIGTFTPAVENPLTVAFYESRLCFGGTNQRPDVLFFSMAPDPADGDTRYDNFTGGTDPDDACFFALAPVNGRVAYLTWLRGSARYLLAGTFGGPHRVSGSGVEEPITTNSVNVRQIDAAGCAPVMAAGGARTFFIERGGRALRTFRWNGEVDDLETYDMLLNAEHMGYSPLTRVAFLSGRPDTLLAIREDGLLVGMTVQGSENVAGWYRIKVGGLAPKVLDAQGLPRTTRGDQLWVVTERNLGGVTRRFVEVAADDVEFPDLADFFSGGSTIFADSGEASPGLQRAGEVDDLATYKAAVYRRQEEYVHLDAAGTYNGADRGVAAGATLTPGALTGDDVAFTASASVFAASDVGNELWKKPDRDTGIGAGRAVITAYVSPTEVTCDIEVDFDSLEAVDPGGWYIAADEIVVPHLDGAVVAVVTDGGVYSDGRGDEDEGDYPLVEVTNGKITLTAPAAVVHVGLYYEGFLETQNLSQAQTKPRNIIEMFIRFLWTLGARYGVGLYDLSKIDHRDAGNDALDRPAPVFSGIKRLHNPGGWAAEKELRVVVSQQLPLPCVVQFVDTRFDVGEEA